MTEKTFLRLEIPKEMKKELKIIATKQETTMTNIITTLIKQYIQDYNKNEKS